MNKSLLLALLIGGGLLMFSKKSWAIPENGRKYQSAFLAAEREYNIPNNLLARVAYQESRFRPEIIGGQTISSANAVGLMQIIPRWHPDVDPRDPYDSINYAGFYLRQNYDRFGSWDKALAAYNWGPTILAKTIREHGDSWLEFVPTETYNYVKQIGADIPRIYIG